MKRPVIGTNRAVIRTIIRATLFASLLARSITAAVGEEISGDYYDWKKTGQPERPYLHPYHQTLVMKLFLCWKFDNDKRGPNQVVDGSNVYLTFEQALEVIKKLDCLTLGIPKIVYLVGWQHNGHDSKYPDWSVVNPRLKRPRDATAVDSLKWLMGEGFKYHTTVSLHINMLDAYQDSPLWETYLKNDIIAKDKEGKLLKGEIDDLPGAPARFENQIYYISYAREWETGFAQRRIDGLLAMLPIQKAGTIHIDAFHSLRPIPHAYPQDRYPDQPKSDTRISPFLNYPLEKEIAAQRKIFRYWREKGVDVTCEGSTLFYDLTPSWDCSPWPGTTSLPRRAFRPAFIAAHPCARNQKSCATRSTSPACWNSFACVSSPGTSRTTLLRPRGSKRVARATTCACPHCGARRPWSPTAARVTRRKNGNFQWTGRTFDESLSTRLTWMAPESSRKRPRRMVGSPLLSNRARAYA